MHTVKDADNNNVVGEIRSPVGIMLHTNVKAEATLPWAMMRTSNENPSANQLPSPGTRITAVIIMYRLYFKQRNGKVTNLNACRIQRQADTQQLLFDCGSSLIFALGIERGKSIDTTSANQMQTRCWLCKGAVLYQRLSGRLPALSLNRKLLLPVWEVRDKGDAWYKVYRRKSNALYVELCDGIRYCRFGHGLNGGGTGMFKNQSAAENTIG